MMKLFVGLFLALVALPLAAQVTHVTADSGKITFNFKTSDDPLVAHFELCATVGVTPVACAPTALFSPFSVTSKAADATAPGNNIYTVGPPLPASFSANRAGESTLVVVRACTGAATGAGCSAATASNPFVLDLSAPTNVRVQ